MFVDTPCCTDIPLLTSCNHCTSWTSPTFFNPCCRVTAFVALDISRQNGQLEPASKATQFLLLVTCPTRLLKNQTYQYIDTVHMCISTKMPLYIQCVSVVCGVCACVYRYAVCFIIDTCEHMRTSYKCTPGAGHIAHQTQKVPPNGTNEYSMSTKVVSAQMKLAKAHRPVQYLWISTFEAMALRKHALWKAFLHLNKTQRKCSEFGWTWLPKKASRTLARHTSATGMYFKIHSKDAYWMWNKLEVFLSLYSCTLCVCAKVKSKPPADCSYEKNRSAAAKGSQMFNSKAALDRCSGSFCGMPNKSD